MQKKTIYLLTGLGLLAGAAVYAYKKGIFSKKPVTDADIKNAQKDSSISNGLIAVANQVKDSSISIANPSSLKAKISVIQQWLGVSPDGILGPVTLKALNAKYPLVTQWNDTNISSLYDKLIAYQKGNTDSMLNWTSTPVKNF